VYALELPESVSRFAQQREYHVHAARVQYVDIEALTDHDEFQNRVVPEALRHVPLRLLVAPVLPLPRGRPVRVYVHDLHLGRDVDIEDIHPPTHPALI